MIFSPGVGLGSSRPYLVWIRPGKRVSVAMPGREVNSDVPYSSDPEVMLNGAPELRFTNGLKRKFHLVLMDPPMKARLRTSYAEGAYSPACEYGLDGYVPNPSVLLIARFNI